MTDWKPTHAQPGNAPPSNPDDGSASRTPAEMRKAYPKGRTKSTTAPGMAQEQSMPDHIQITVTALGTQIQEAMRQAAKNLIAQIPSTWQAMEAAPRDGTLIIIGNPDWAHTYAVHYDCDDCWFGHNYPTAEPEPGTVWRPMPAPPLLDVCGVEHHSGVKCIRQRHGLETNHVGRGASWDEPGNQAEMCRFISPAPEHLVCSDLASPDSEFCLAHEGTPS